MLQTEGLAFRVSPSPFSPIQKRWRSHNNFLKLVGSGKGRDGSSLLKGDLCAMLNCSYSGFSYNYFVLQPEEVYGETKVKISHAMEFSLG